MDQLDIGVASHAPQTAAMERPTRVRYLVLTVACSLAILTYVQRLAFTNAETEIKSSFGLDSQDWGYLVAAFLIAYGLFQVPCGILGDRLGARRLLTSLVVGWSLTTAAFACVYPVEGLLWLPLVLLLALRSLFGAFQAGAFPPLGRVVADWIPVPRRATAQGLIWMASRFGGAAVPFVLIGLFKWFGDWRLPFVLLAGLGLIWAIGFYWWFRNKPEEKSGVNLAERSLIGANRPLAPVKPGPVPWGRMFRTVSVWGLFLTYGGSGFAGNFMTTALTGYLHDKRQMSKDDAKIASSLPLALGIATCSLGGLVADALLRRWGNRNWARRAVGGTGLTLAGLCMLSTVWIENPWVAASLLAITFFFGDLSMGPVWASATDVGERYAATLSGAMNMTGQITGAIAAVVIGYMLKHDHTHLVFVVLSGGYFFAALSWLLIDATKRVSDAPALSEGT